MIAHLRKRHFRLFIALGIVLPPLFAAGLLSRTQVPFETVEAFGGLTDTTDFPVALAHDTLRFDAYQVEAITRADASPPASISVWLRPLTVITEPDLLVYWDISPDHEGDLANAYLTGTLSGGSWTMAALPDSALRSDGHLILYSLGHHTVVGTSELRTTSNGVTRAWD